MPDPQVPTSPLARAVRLEHLETDAVDDVTYSADALDVLAGHSGGSWWNDHRARWAVRVASRHGISQIVEVGAGNGAMTVPLHGAGIDIVALEPHRAGVERLREAGIPAARATSHALDAAGAVPALAYFDVLEHLVDPVDELRRARELLRPGGLVIATVPAYAWMWSDEDVYAGHERRYTRSMIADHAHAADLEVVSNEHLFAVLVPPAYVVRRVLRRGGPASVSSDQAAGALAAGLDPPAPVAWAATAVLRAEELVGRLMGPFGGWPFGLSIGCVLRRQR